jgi:hypothetical protein
MELDTKQLKDVTFKLDECSTHLNRLNDWEQNFIESVQDQVLMYGTISEKQIERLEELYNKAMK